jgi:PAS domain S-box-containing protein
MRLDTMTVPLHLLVLEDNPSDAELIIFELRRAGFEPDWKRVETEGDFLAALDPALDLILADYRLPQFDGLRALDLVQESKLGIPLLLVSGTIGEELAVEAMKKGAADYLMKDRLARLGPAVKQVLERKQAEEKLGASENELRALFAAMTDVVLVLDGDGRYLRIAPTNPANLYRPPAEMLGKTVYEVLPKEQADYMIAITRAAIQTKQAVSGEYALQIDGKEIWFASSTSRLSENSAIWVAHDISERKRAEEELKKSEDKFRAIFDNASDGIFIVDLKTRKLFMCNTMCAKMLDYTQDEFLNLDLADIHPREDMHFIYEQIEKFSRGEEGIRSDIKFKRKNGSIFAADLSPAILIIAEKEYLLINYKDITARKQAEEEILRLNATLEQRIEKRTRALREAQEHLVRHEKLAILGQLAGGVGHELRNPLGVISNSVYYLELVQPDANEKIRKHHAIIAQEVHNAARIVSDLLDYAREISTEPQPVSVRELVEHTLSRFPVPTSIQTRIRIPADLPQVYADPLHVEQILGNLVTNACQAMSAISLNTKADSFSMPKGAKLSISACAVVSVSGRKKQKKMVAIAVKDTGTGIIPENLQKLFEPLFSTKVTGIGLGLAVSKKLAEANGGRIEVKSQAGKGSTFTLYLPVKSE